MLPKSYPHFDAEPNLLALDCPSTLGVGQGVLSRFQFFECSLILKQIFKGKNEKSLFINR